MRDRDIVARHSIKAKAKAHHLRMHCIKRIRLAIKRHKAIFGDRFQNCKKLFFVIKQMRREAKITSPTLTLCEALAYKLLILAISSR